ncbi:MAG: hypothetical protein JXB25_12110 [Deltaproteobacteria bacterium]|nr:hypothetical protein [Deltaproteobacteria bacterium]
MEKVPPSDHAVRQPGEVPQEAVFQFLQLLNAHRKKLLIYPVGHPLLDQSLNLVVQYAGNLFRGRDAVSFIAARGKLHIADTPLDPGNRVFQDFARALTDRGILLLIFRCGLNREELQNFALLLNLKPEEFVARGGVEPIFQEAAFEHLEARGMDYSVLQVEEVGAEPSDLPLFSSLDSEFSPEAVWGKFVAALLEDPFFGGAASDALSSEISSQQLADLLNRLFPPPNNHLPETGLQKSMACFLGDISGPETDGYQPLLMVLEKFEQFLQNLHPHLRSQFQQHLFHSDLKNLKAVERILRSFSGQTLWEILDDINRNNLTVSENVLALMEQLSHSRRHEKQKKFQMLPDPLLREKLQTLFHEDVGEHFGSEDYRRTLHALIKKAFPQNELEDDIKRLRRTLTPQQVELQQSRVILELFNLDTETGSKTTLGKKLADSIAFFLQTGNFSSLVELHRRLMLAREKAGEENSLHYQQLLALFFSPDFMREVLETLATWGKENLDDIRYLIRANGRFFISPLLEQLAEEGNRFLRRFIIDELIEIGRDGNPEPFLAKLGDKRWYFVRNLVTILRAFEDPTISRELRRIANHPHVKVRKEIIQTLYHFRDPLADTLVSQDLRSHDEERRLNALIAAESSSAPEILEKLLNVIREKGLTDPELEIKKQAVRSLAGIGNPQALALFSTTLNSISLFNAKRLTALKQEILQNLPRFSSPEAAAILKEYSGSRNKELATAAQEALKKLR